MRLQELLNEGYSKGRPVICVDVQPAYMDYTPNQYKWSVASFLAEHKAPILMYVNAEQEGLTSDNIQNDIIPMWHELFEEVGHDFEEDGAPKMEWFDKGYGYLRSWMDIGVQDKYIVAVIREMYSQKVHDSRDLFGGDEEKIAEYLKPVARSLNTEPETLVGDPMVVGWTAIDQLKRYNNCYLIGGGRNECLKEVALLMNAFNIKYKLIDELIYG